VAAVVEHVEAKCAEEGDGVVEVLDVYDRVIEALELPVFRHRRPLFRLRPAGFAARPSRII
jgi:hypothetical protein